MTYVKINGKQYPAEIRGCLHDNAWDGRDSKAVTLEMSYQEAQALFRDNAPWSIVYQADADAEEYDNSAYEVAGPITDNRDGTMTCKMGRPTEKELLAILLGGDLN